ncbi:MAG: ribonuclease P protein component [Lewinellaceae bacterium]|nr:ribonuclease P protein component [Phaeodactylibacter sp.]MCB9036924.1 ribonuclease P protein component [Lewinellaceae bacterium]
MPSYTFQRGERLKSRKVIGALFKEGKSFGQYPLRVVYMPMKERRSEFPAQFTVSVPKKKFPKAVARNRIRRQIREAWRLNKHRLYRAMEGEKQQYALLLIYVAKDALPYPEIEHAMRQVIRRLGKRR